MVRCLGCNFGETVDTIYSKKELIVKSHFKPISKNNSPGATASLSDTKAGLSTVIWYLLKVMDPPNENHLQPPELLAAGSCRAPRSVGAWSTSQAGSAPSHPQQSVLLCRLEA